MNKWIKFKKDTGSYKANSFAEVDETVARTFITMDVAELAPEDPLQRSLSQALCQFEAAMDARLTAQAASQAQTRSNRPGTLAGDDQGVPFSRIAAGPNAVDHRRAGPGHFIRSVITSLGNPDREAAEAAHRDLTRPWEEGGYGTKRTMTEGTGSSFGYATPVVYEQQFFEVAAEKQVIIPFADERPLATRQVEWPALNQYSAPAAGQSAMFGGVQVYRKGETKQRTSSDLSAKKIQMVAQDLTTLHELSRDLVFDAPGVDAYTVRMLGGAIGWREDWESINGNGAGQFLGYLNSPATLFAARNTTGSILYQDVFTMKTRLMSQAMSPCWLCHPYTIYAIETLQDPSGRFIFIPYTTAPTETAGGIGGGITYRPSGNLLGWPLYTSEKVPPLGTAGDLSLIDRKMYWIGRRGGVEIGLSEHFLFDTDELAIRSKVRNDGKPGQLAPFYLADGTGSNQVSGFVSLAH